MSSAQNWDFKQFLQNQEKSWGIKLVKQCFLTVEEEQGFSLLDLKGDGNRKSPSFIPSCISTNNQFKKKEKKEILSQPRGHAFIFHTSMLKMQSLHLMRVHPAQAQRLSGSSNPHMGNKYHAGQDLVRDQSSSLQSFWALQWKKKKQQKKPTSAYSRFRFGFQDTLNRCCRVHHMPVTSSLARRYVSKKRESLLFTIFDIILQTCFSPYTHL